MSNVFARYLQQPFSEEAINEIYDHIGEIKDLDGGYKYALAQRLTQFLCDQQPIIYETIFVKAIKLLSPISSHSRGDYVSLFDQLMNMVTTMEFDEQFSCCFTLLYCLESPI
jgi:hypothetical protein